MPSGWKMRRSKNSSSVIPLTISTTRPSVSKPGPPVYCHSVPGWKLSGTVPHAFTRSASEAPGAMFRRAKCSPAGPSAATVIPAVWVSRSCSVMSRCTGTSRRPAPRGSVGWFHSATLPLANSGMNFDTGSPRISCPCSMSIRTATAVIGLVIDAMRKSVPVCIGFFASRSIWPCASRCTTLPLRATSVTAPDRSPASTCRLTSGAICSSRLAEKPTSSGLDVGSVAPATTR